MGFGFGWWFFWVWVMWRLRLMIAMIPDWVDTFAILLAGQGVMEVSRENTVPILTPHTSVDGTTMS